MSRPAAGDSRHRPDAGLGRTFCTQSLGALGAEVRQIEPPGGGETRRSPPFIAGESHYFLGRDEVDRTISEVTRTRSVAEWQERLAAFDGAHAPVLGVTAAPAHPHARARGMVVEAEHPAAGPMRLVGRPIKFPGAPQCPSTTPRILGQHTSDVLRDELGYSEAEIAALRRNGVIDRVTART